MILNSSLLGALRCFEVAARHCNFTHAAAELHLTPGAVSHQIRQLEQRLGRPLFKRLPRGLALTPEAQELLKAASEAFLKLELAVQKIGAEKTPLHVSCTPTFAMMWLMPRLNRFYARHPDIQIRLIAEFQRIDHAGMSSQGVDIAIRYLPRDDSVGQLALMDEYLLPVASRDYLSEHPFEPESDSAQAGTLLHDAWPWDGADRDAEWRVWMERQGYRPGARYGEQDFSLFMLAYSAAQNGQGLCMGRIAMVIEALRRGALQRASERVVMSSAHYSLLATDLSDERVEALVEWLRGECAEFSEEFAAYIHDEGLRVI